ncbi:hypothetical protein ACFY04_37465 [Streptomyces sp. NPDC001549]|uniref:hypothetical protein n=1 Tax=Streptomyces sp. NPDC001549 TaxID=3364586 RepID=UPI00368218A3
MSGTLSSGWCLGALRLPGPLHPPGPARCPLPAGSDRERSLRLLKAIDEAADDGLSGEWSEFERVVLYGSAGAPGWGYPPPGHGYPRL